MESKSDNQWYQININEIEFLNGIARHPKLDVEFSILLLDLMTKYLISNIIMSNMIRIGIQTINNRFMENQ